MKRLKYAEFNLKAVVTPIPFLGMDGRVQVSDSTPTPPRDRRHRWERTGSTKRRHSWRCRACGRRRWTTPIVALIESRINKAQRQLSRALEAQVWR